MYFINKKRRLPSREIAIHILPAAAVLLTLLGITGLAWNNAKLSLRSEQKAVSTDIAHDTSNQIREQLTNYELVLTAAAGLFASSSTVDRQEWSDFIDSFELQEKYPGIQGVGFAKQLQKDNIPEFIAGLEQEGFKNPRIYPATGRPEMVVNYLYHPRNNGSVGYDLLSDTIRREALVYAKNAGTSALTGKLDFVKSQDELGSTGISMFLPFMSTNHNLNTPLQSGRCKGLCLRPLTPPSFLTAYLPTPATNQQVHII